MSINNLDIRPSAGRAEQSPVRRSSDPISYRRNGDFILSTVVLMFLEAKTIPELIANMQRCTRCGPPNLIVAAMDTDDYPCTVISCCLEL